MTRRTAPACATIFTSWISRAATSRRSPTWRSITGESIFNLGTGKGYSVLEMVHAFETANHVHVPYRIAPRRAGDLPTVYACPDKSARILGWRAQYSLEDMCRDSWRWQTQNPNGYETA